MVGVKFSRLMERKSAELSEELVRRLVASERTPAYRDLDAEALRRDYEGLMLDLTEWLVYRSPEEVEARCRRLGAMRAAQGVPLEQCVTAMLICKQHLIDRMCDEAGWGEVELFGELEFVLAVGRLFDDAIFHCMLAHAAFGAGEQQAA